METSWIFIFFSSILFYILRSVGTLLIWLSSLLCSTLSLSTKVSRHTLEIKVFETKVGKREKRVTVGNLCMCVE